MSAVSVVVPTLGRPSLGALLAALPSTVDIVVVDDRPHGGAPLHLPNARLLHGRGAGPAAARNTGWRATKTDWVVFLDDDVIPEPGWYEALLADLDVAPDVGGVQGRIRVPGLPARPTDWQRVTAGLQHGAWLTADMAYRRTALEAVGGFDERFPRAFREDADLAHRVRTAGWQLRRGARTVAHPVRPESWWVSVRTQRGNLDDALLRQMYGPLWRTVLEVPQGRRSRHAATTVAGLAAAGLLIAARARRSRSLRVAGWVAAGAWAAATAEFAAARIAPGPRTWREVAAMSVTSVVIPPVAVGWWLLGLMRARGARPQTGAVT